MQHGSNHHILCMLDIVPHLSFMVLHIFNLQHLTVIFKEEIISSVRSRLHCVPKISRKMTGSPLKKAEILAIRSCGIYLSLHRFDIWAS